MSLLEELVIAHHRTGDDLYVMLTTEQVGAAIDALEEVNSLRLKLDLMAALILERDRQIARLNADLEDWQGNSLPMP